MCEDCLAMGVTLGKRKKTVLPWESPWERERITKDQLIVVKANYYL